MNAWIIRIYLGHFKVQYVISQGTSCRKSVGGKDYLNSSTVQYKEALNGFLDKCSNKEPMFTFMLWIALGHS